MAFRATVCGGCQREIQVPIDLPHPACRYCGHAEKQEGAAPAATVSTLMGLARTALSAGNGQEALDYFNRVLESEPTSPEAWLGKGKAAGWQSSIAHMRFPEMLIAFNHAIANASDAGKQATISQAIEEANRLITTLYGMARKHLLEYVALQTSWAEYLQRVAQMIDALEEISKWDAGHRITLENIVHLCKDNIEGVSFRDQFHNNLPKAWTLTPQYENLLKSKLDSATVRLKVIDPSYSPPTIEKQKADSCFVVTATMGDADHPTVTFMRQFRDNWILNQSWGPAFVGWYYRHGPKAASFIARSSWRRKLSYFFIVRTSAWVARRLM